VTNKQLTAWAGPQIFSPPNIPTVTHPSFPPPINTPNGGTQTGTQTEQPPDGYFPPPPPSGGTSPETVNTSLVTSPNDGGIPTPNGLPGVEAGLKTLPNWAKWTLGITIVGGVVGGLVSLLSSRG
jgi:hypothetical protein